MPPRLRGAGARQDLGRARGPSLRGPADRLGQDGLGAAKMQLQSFGFGPEAVEAFLRGRYTVSLHGVDSYEWSGTYEWDGETHEYSSQATLPNLILTFEYYEGEPGVVHEIVATGEGLLEQAGAEVGFEKVELGGRTVGRLTDPQGQSPIEILYYVENDRFVLGTKRETLVAFMQAGQSEGGDRWHPMPNSSRRARKCGARTRSFSPMHPSSA